MTWKGICESCGAEQPCELCSGETLDMKTSEIFGYEKDDYLLVNKVGKVVAVSGNTDFEQPRIPSGPYVVVKVVEQRWRSLDTGWISGESR